MSTLSPSNLPWSAPRFRFSTWTFLLQRPAKRKKPLLTRRTSLYHVSNYHWSTSNSFTVHKCMAMATYRACVASVSVGLVNKERPRNEIFGVFPARKMGREPKIERGGWGRGTKEPHLPANGARDRLG